MVRQDVDMQKMSILAAWIINGCGMSKRAVQPEKLYKPKLSASQMAERGRVVAPHRLAWRKRTKE
tara:strand:+ start:218 stop:412 length:195 start_codon:yes stop_codon:yes gene_type:complete